MANFNIDYLVVAGGGGGGYLGGGGGAGGYRTSFGTGNINGGQTPVENSLTLTTGTQYTVSIGAAGIGATNNTGQPSTNLDAGSGGDSLLSGTGITTITSTGGGGGGIHNAGNGATGGSGGGGCSSSSSRTGAASVTNPIQGFAGAANQPSGVYPAGGGGGAFAAGFNNANGGTAMSSLITGISTPRAGGGGGGLRQASGAISGSTGGGGGAGNGSYTNATGGNATASTGSGGGGGGLSSANQLGSGGNGGSGVVILRYTTADANYTATGLTPTEDTTTISGQTILSFTTVGTGTIIFSTPPPPTLGTRVTNPVTGFESPVDIGLKLPSGTNANQPSGTQGMIRNDTGETTVGSTSAIEHYNGTTWKYFAATESVDNPLFASQNFNTVLYDGNSGVKTINTVGFQPDLVWTKARDYAGLQGLTNSINGDKTFNIANTTAAINTNSSAPKSFNSLGFTLGAGNSNWNNSVYDYVAWNWKGGGLINESADFNGSSSKIVVTDSSENFTFSNHIGTISTWVYLDSTTGEIASKRGTGNPGARSWIFNVTSGVVNFYTFNTDSNSQLVSSNSTLSIKKWYHLAVTLSQSYIKIYINGVLDNTAASIYTSIQQDGADFGIGFRGKNSGYNYFDGLINQVRVFNTTLLASEVTELYNETAADNSTLNYPQDAGCFAAYPLGENANDLSNTYNGTASNVTFGKPGYLTRNTEGTIESTVSANVAAGFSIVAFNSGTNSSYTVGTGLNAPPEIVISKVTNIGTANWPVFHKDFTNPDQAYILLASTAGVVNSGLSLWNYSNWGTNKIGATNVMFGSNNNVINYCFHSVPGYSKISSYVGDGSTDHFISTGFEPAFVMIKRTDSTSNWRIFDNKRGTQKELYANSNSVEPSNVSYINFNNLGFTLTSNGGWINNLNGKFIYMAFATS